MKLTNVIIIILIFFGVPTALAFVPKFLDLKAGIFIEMYSINEIFCVLVIPIYLVVFSKIYNHKARLSFPKSALISISAIIIAEAIIYELWWDFRFGFDLIDILICLIILGLSVGAYFLACGAYFLACFAVKKIFPPT